MTWAEGVSFVLSMAVLFGFCGFVIWIIHLENERDDK